MLAATTATELVLVDIGSRCDPLRETPTYRCRNVRSGVCELVPGSALTAAEFRAAFVVGQSEAERAAKDGVKVIAADALGAGSADAALRVGELLGGKLGTTADPVPGLAGVCGADLAAAAGFFAKAAELELTVLVCGAFAEVALALAERLHPGTGARAVLEEPTLPALARPTPPAPLPEGRGEQSGPPSLQGGGWGVGSASEGVGALFAFPALDAAAAVVAGVARRTRAHEQVVSVRRRKVAIFTGSFDPPTTFHRRVATMLRERGFDEVIVRPNGPKGDADEQEHASPIHRAVLADLAFRDLPGVSVDLSDLDDGVFTPHVAFDDLHADRGEVWHVVSDEFVSGGRDGRSWIQTKWECGADAWRGERFVVLHPEGRPPDAADLPPACKLVEAAGHVPTADIRMRVFQGGTANPDVPPAVEAYIRRYGLFSGTPSPRETRVRLADVRLKIVYDERNAKARGFAEQFRRYEAPDPTHVLALGGDGTMLQAIRDHWRLRLPFIGLNAGTLGFLMNESLPADLENSELVLYRMPMLRVDTEAPDGKCARRWRAATRGWSGRAGRRRGCGWTWTAARRCRRWWATGCWWRPRRGPVRTRGRWARPRCR